MLHTLFANENKARVLLFLFVNTTAYPSQMASVLDVPLTPLQHSCSQLEKAGVITSVLQGKIRLYQFNLLYPLRHEIMALIQKAYTFLPSHEKKRYCLLYKPKQSAEIERENTLKQKRALSAFWNLLSRVERIAVSHQEGHLPPEWGTAEVVVSAPDPTIFILEGQGHWLVNGIPHRAFSNSFRFTWDLQRSLIGLEHMRYGKNHPVFLFHLAYAGHNHLESVDPHLCNQDTYLGHIAWDEQGFDFRWRTIGPTKNSHLLYRYSTRT